LQDNEHNDDYCNIAFRITHTVDTAWY